MYKKHIINIFCYAPAILFLSWIAVLPVQGASSHSEGKEFELPVIFSDGMVLQAGKSVPIWGKGEAGVEVEVKIDDCKAVVRVNPDGKWELQLPPHDAGGPYEMTVCAGDDIHRISDVYYGEVWLAGGQSNMQMNLAALTFSDGQGLKADPLLRIWTVPRVAHPDAQREIPQLKEAWMTFDPDEARYVSAVGYAFAVQLRELLGVPVALIQCNYGGTPAESWVSREVLESDPRWKVRLEGYDRMMEAQSSQEHYQDYQAYLKELTEYRRALQDWANGGKKGLRPEKPHLDKGPYHKSHPAGLYETMIQRVAPYGIRGILFYQGEANASRAPEYADLLTALIGLWRKDWRDPSLPFYFVQLSAWGKGMQWPELRAARAEVADTVPGTGMAVSLDLGDRQEIHYSNKLPVGDRLARLALNRTYGMNIVDRGPHPRAVDAHDGALEIVFSDVARGLTVSDGGKVAGFEVVIQDGKVLPVTGTIQGRDRVLLHFPEQAGEIRAIRYGWSAFPDPMVNLYNSEGLPAEPFLLRNESSNGVWSWR